MPKRKPSKPSTGLPLDREANAALIAWGTWTATHFLDVWKEIEPALVARACTVVGLPALKRWTRTHKLELHRRAVRFAHNTSV